MAKSPMSPMDSLFFDDDSAEYALSMSNDLSLALDFDPETFDLEKSQKRNEELESKLIHLMRTLSEVKERYFLDKDMKERLLSAPLVEEDAGQVAMLSSSMEYTFKEIARLEKERQKINDEREHILNQISRVLESENKEKELNLVKRKLEAINHTVNLAYDPSLEVENLEVDTENQRDPEIVNIEEDALEFEEKEDIYQGRFLDEEEIFFPENYEAKYAFKEDIEDEIRIFTPVPPPPSKNRVEEKKKISLSAISEAAARMKQKEIFGFEDDEDNEELPDIEISDYEEVNDSQENDVSEENNSNKKENFKDSADLKSMDLSEVDLFS